MTRFPLGMIILLIASILVYFGLAHRALDRMRLTDKGALVVIGALVAGSFINITLVRTPIEMAINVGGAVVPIALAIYVLSKAGTTKEWIRALLATAITGTSLYLIGRLMGFEPENTLIDPIYVYPIVAGLVAYITGRSRRGAFIGATLGVLSVDIGTAIYLFNRGIPGSIRIGGAGAFDSIVLSGIFAILLAEVIGETRERLQGGPRTKGRPKELLKGLKNIEVTNMLIDSKDANDTAEERGNNNEK